MMDAAVPNTPARLRIAVVGAGLGSAPHFLSLEDLADKVDWVWLCARNEDRLALVKVPEGTLKTTHLEDVLQDASVQAVLVLTPPNTHLDIVQRIAAAGKHVLVEKPLEIDIDRANELVEVCEVAGVLLGVMLQHRLREGAQCLAALIKAGTLGEFISGSASVRWWRPQTYYDEPGRGTLARDGGGVLITQAIHTLDLLLSLTGLPEQVTGMARTSPVHSMETEDTAAALLHYTNGAVAVVQATTAAWPGFPEHIELNFTRGSATLEAGELQVHLASGDKITAGSRQASGGQANPMAFDHDAHRAVLLDFVSAVQNGKALAITGRSALAVHRLIEAIMTSSAGGHTVRLDPATPIAMI